MVQPKQVLYQPVDIDDEEFADFTEQKTEEEIDFEKFRDEMRESNQYAKITVSRQPTTSDGRPGQQRLIFLFECGVDEYSFSQLCSRCRDQYGSGTFRIQARNEKGQLKINKAVQVEAPKVEDTGDGGTSAGEIISRMSEAMHQHQNRTEQMVEKLMPQANPMGMLTEMATAMAAIMGTFQNQQTPTKSMLDQLTEFKMLQELFSGGNGGGGDANMFSLLTETVKSFGPLMGAAIMAQQKTGAIPASGPIQPLLPNPETVEPHHAEKTTLSAELETMRPQIDFLVAQAQAGAKPADVAAAIIPGIPENSLEAIEQFLQQENVIDICAQVNAGVNTHRAWFAQWRDIMLKTIADMFETPPEAEPEAEPEVLTGISEQEQDSAAVEGHDLSEVEHSAATATDPNNVKGDPTGDGGDAGDAEPDAPTGAPV